MSEHAVVFVDLIEDEPKTLVEFGEDAPEPYDDVKALETAYRDYLARFQPFRWHSTSEGNHRVLGLGERYFNAAGAEHNIRLQFSGDTIVYLRRNGCGDELLRDAYPKVMGDIVSIGPACFAATNGSVLNWRGVNYVPQDVQR